MDAQSTPWPVVAWLLLAAVFLMTLALLAWEWWQTSRWLQRGHATVRSSPPDDEYPAIVAALLPNHTVQMEAFVATLLDLIRRAHVLASPRQRPPDRASDGRVLVDLHLVASGDPASMPPWDGHVAGWLRRTMPPEGMPLSALADQLVRRHDDFAATFKRFTQQVRAEAPERGVLGNGIPAWSGAFIATVAAVLIAFLGAPPGGSHELLAVAATVHWMVFGVPRFMLSRYVVRVRRGREDWWTAWMGYRDYLADPARVREQPPRSIREWEQLLVYGVALGLGKSVWVAVTEHGVHKLERRSALFAMRWGPHHPGDAVGHVRLDKFLEWASGVAVDGLRILAEQRADEMLRRGFAAKGFSRTDPTAY